MKLLEIKVTLPPTKPRNPNQEVLAAKKNAGGPMRKPREGVPRDEKHRKDPLAEGRDRKNVMYQVKIGLDDWKDIPLDADTLEDIAASTEASPADTKSHDRFDVSQLTEIVEQYIGEGPNGPDTTWDEMDFDVQSLGDDVLKIKYTFSGMHPRRQELITKTGVITIMPGAVSEAVAGPFEKFSKGDKVKVKKTGQEATVVSQNDIGLVFTMADDAKAHFSKGGHAQAKGYKEYMPRELERISESLAKGELEKKILRELENIFLSKVDSDGRHGWNEYNKETQLDYVMSYGSGQEVLKRLERRGDDSLDDIAKFFKQPAHEQFKQLLPYFERIEF